MAKLTPETEATHPGCLPLELPAPRAAEPRHQATCVGRVALAVAHQGSLRPVRAHIRAYGSSADRFAIPEGSPQLFARVPWTCVRTSMCSACVPRSSLPADASLPSTGSSGASSPASSVLSKRYDFRPPFPPHFVSCPWKLQGWFFYFFGDTCRALLRTRSSTLVGCNPQAYSRVH